MASGLFRTNHFPTNSTVLAKDLHQGDSSSPGPEDQLLDIVVPKKNLSLKKIRISLFWKVLQIMKDR